MQEEFSSFKEGFPKFLLRPRSVFNMSGRRRLSFEQDGVWEGPLRLHLVVIGVDMDKQKILLDLEGMCVRSSVPR